MAMRLFETPDEVEKCAHIFVDGETFCRRGCGALNYQIIGGRAHCGNCGNDWTEYVGGWVSGNYDHKAATWLQCGVCKSKIVIFEAWRDESKSKE